MTRFVLLATALFAVTPAVLLILAANAAEAVSPDEVIAEKLILGFEEKELSRNDEVSREEKPGRESWFYLLEQPEGVDFAWPLPTRSTLRVAARNRIPGSLWTLIKRSLSIRSGKPWGSNETGRSRGRRLAGNVPPDQLAANRYDAGYGRLGRRCLELHHRVERQTGQKAGTESGAET